VVSPLAVNIAFEARNIGIRGYPAALVRYTAAAPMTVDRARSAAMG
jgi:hypothetical protein